jgi:hypothetical protein
MKKLLPSLLIALVWLSVFKSTAQDESRKHRIVTMTRLQSFFGDLEHSWLKAVQEKDQAALKRILWDQFSLWTPVPPGDPVPLEDWIHQAFSRKLQSFRIEQLAARSVTLDVTVASFVLTETFDEGGEQKTEQHYIVDVWHDEGNNHWRCTDRYSSVATGMQPSTAEPEKRPTGRE